MKNRLILLEGLPGTGKSTNSFKLYEQLLLNEKRLIGSMKFRSRIRSCFLRKAAWLKEQRGERDLTSMWERDQGEPYYQSKQKDVTAFYDFLKDYARYAEALFETMKLDKRKIEISENNWNSYDSAILGRRFNKTAWAANYSTMDGDGHGIY